MPVRFDPVVKVKEIEITKEEHIQEIKNPKNVIRIIPDKVSGKYEPLQESLSNGQNIPNTQNTQSTSKAPSIPSKTVKGIVQVWVIILILILIIIISLISRRTPSEKTAILIT